MVLRRSQEARDHKQGLRDPGVPYGLWELGLGRMGLKVSRVPALRLRARPRLWADVTVEVGGHYARLSYPTPADKAGLIQTEPRGEHGD